MVCIMVCLRVAPEHPRQHKTHATNKQAPADRQADTRHTHRHTRTTWYCLMHSSLVRGCWRRSMWLR
jgi:hypothetical protein